MRPRSHARDGRPNDGSGRPRSPFTAALLKHFASRDAIHFIFRLVRHDAIELHGARAAALRVRHKSGTLGTEKIYVAQQAVWMAPAVGGGPFRRGARKSPQWHVVNKLRVS
jgi:hypothetical protein